MTNRHEQIKFELACLDYVRAVYTQSPVVSTSHKWLAKLNAAYDANRIVEFTNALFNHVDSGTTRTFCFDWADDDNTPHLLIDPVSLNALGQLVAVDYELVANSPGIQTWSKRSA